MEKNDIYPKKIKMILFLNSFLIKDIMMVFFKKYSKPCPLLILLFLSTFFKKYTLKNYFKPIILIFLILILKDK